MATISFSDLTIDTTKREEIGKLRTFYEGEKFSFQGNEKEIKHKKAPTPLYIPSDQNLLTQRQLQGGRARPPTQRTALGVPLEKEK